MFLSMGTCTCCMCTYNAKNSAPVYIHYVYVCMYAYNMYMYVHIHYVFFCMCTYIQSKVFGAAVLLLNMIDMNMSASTFIHPFIEAYIHL